MLVFLARMYSLRAVFSQGSRLMDTAPPFLRGHPSHAKRFIRFKTIDNTFLLSFLQTPSIGVESATSRSANKRSSTWANPATCILFCLCFKCVWAFAVLSSCYLMFRPGWVKDLTFLAVAQVHCWDSGSSWGCRRKFRYSTGIKSRPRPQGAFAPPPKPGKSALGTRLINWNWKNNLVLED